MKRDDLIKALQAQEVETDVQVSLGGFLLDLSRVDYDDERVAIVLETLTEDIEDVIVHVTARPWWRGSSDGNSRGHFTADASARGVSDG